MFDLPTLGLVIITSIINALNPCTIGILILTISVILGQGASPSRLLKSGSFYLLAVLAIYFMAGISFALLLSSLPDSFTLYLNILISLLIVTAGLIQIKDFFWYGKGFSLQIPSRFVNKIHKKSIKHKNTRDMLMFGMFAGLVVIPCSGASYLAVIAVLDTEFTLAAVSMILLYNLLFIIPLYFILIKVVRGTKISKISMWKEKNKSLMRLASGILLIGLGWILLLVTNGTVSFG